MQPAALPAPQCRHMHAEAQRACFPGSSSPALHTEPHPAGVFRPAPFVRRGGAGGSQSPHLPWSIGASSQNCTARAALPPHGAVPHSFSYAMAASLRARHPPGRGLSKSWCRRPASLPVHHAVCRAWEPSTGPQRACCDGRECVAGIWLGLPQNSGALAKLRHQMLHRSQGSQQNTKIHQRVMPPAS